MNRISKCLEKLWDGGVPVTCVALLVVLLTISILVTGVGLHSAIVWIILASASVLCLALCSCVKCGKRVSRWRSTQRRDADPSERSDSISTVSGLNDFTQHSSMHSSPLPGLHFMYFGGGVQPFWRPDSLPDYSVVAGLDAPPPPYSAVGPPPEEAEPPSYEAVVSGRILHSVLDPSALSTPTIRAASPESVRVHNAHKDNATAAVNSADACEVEMQPVGDSAIIECTVPEEGNSSC